MKLATVLHLAIPAISAAFTPSGMSARPAFATARFGVVSVGGGPAKSKEEDLELTRQVILEFLDKEMGSDDSGLLDDAPVAAAPVAAAPAEE